MKQSRRAFLSTFPVLALEAADKFPALASELKRYPDPATEFTISRLTDPASTSVLPVYYGRAISRHGGFLLYSSDRTGAFQAYRMDLKSGQSRQLTEVKRLETGSPTLLPDEKSCCFVADGALWTMNLGNLRQREAWRAADGFEPSGGLSVSEDGLFAALVEKQPGGCRLKLVDLPKRTASTVVESAQLISDPQVRPHRSGILYRVNGELRVTGFDGSQNQLLKTGPGRVGPAIWSSDGRVVSYLNFPDSPQQVNGIREYTADTNEDRFVAGTTQFVQLGRNSDSSVFVGASGSKASPYVLLLVRAVRRELTLCEHKASDPARVAPRFSPNSQQIFFQTDRHGKWAIYSMAVDRLVEETE